MSNLSKPANGGASRSDVIALWKDSAKGPREISLPSGSDAVVLSISRCYLEEWTADGRSDGENAGQPVLSGIHPISSGI
jgi:hypothetical protein